MRAQLLRRRRASTAHDHRSGCARRTRDEFRSVDLDIRDADGVDRVFAELAADLELVVHTAAQPSHDWAASDPHTDFTVNANGTLNLLEATRQHKPEATFVFTSTNKVYGDRPNYLPLVELETRLELPADHEYYGGIPVTMSIDHTLHSLFGASKAAADLLVQEYGRYFDMPTVCFRGGCLTGPAHQRRAAARLPRLPDALHRHRRAVHDLRLRRQAGARQHPRRRRRQRVRGVPHARRAAPPSTTSAAGARTRSRCSRRSTRCERDRRAASSTTRCPTRRAWATTAGGSPTSTRSAPTTPSWDIAYDLERTLREIHDANVEQLGAGMKLSVVIPAHNEAGSIARDRRRRPRRAARRRRSRTRSSSIDDGSRRRHARDRRSALAADGDVRGVPLALRARLRPRGARGAGALRGRRGGDHDGRRVRRPARPRPLLPRARGRLRLRVRLALHARRRRRRLPAAQAARSTASSTSASACSSSTATTTRRTRSRPTGARSSRRSSRCSPSTST